MPGSVLASTTKTWSQPTPKRRSPKRRSCAGPSSKGWRVASITTKSLPAPCILVKDNCMGRLSRSVEPRLPFGPRFEALVHPQVLRRLLADARLQPAVERGRVGLGVARREVFQRRRRDDLVALAAGLRVDD